VRWRRGGDSPDVIDQRGAGSGTRIPGGARIGIPGGLGLTGLLIFILIQVIGGGTGAQFDVDGFDDRVQAPGGGAIPADQDPERDLKDFSAYVFTNAQGKWDTTFSDQNAAYRRAKLVLYRDGVSTGCGSASSAVGPFYCPADQRVYLDLSFYGDMADQLGASGDFAWAYVIAHEVGHHVQGQLGISEQVRELQRRNPADANDLSVRLELQADCYAGVWAHSVFRAGDLEPGDVDEAVRASQAVGDDRLQRRATGTVDPDSFTHGTAAQRSKWFNAGRTSGEPATCDTFEPAEV
jgi:predicted metalloprotease